MIVMTVVQITEIVCSVILRFLKGFPAFSCSVTMGSSLFSFFFHVLLFCLIVLLQFCFFLLFLLALVRC